MGGAIFYRGTRVSQSKRRKSHGERGYGRPDHREFFCPRRIKGSLIISKYDLHFYLDQYELDSPLVSVLSRVFLDVMNKASPV